MRDVELPFGGIFRGFDRGDLAEDVSLCFEEFVPARYDGG